METVRALIPFALILVAFYFLIVRPGRARQQAARTMQDQLRPGVEVMTTSGMYGRVVSVADDRTELEVAPGTTVAFAKAAIARILTQDAPVAEEGSSGEGDDLPETEDGRSEQDHQAR